MYYEKDEIVSQYCEFHFGDEYFGVKNFPLKIAEIANKYAINRSKALDIGCSVGRASFELTKTFDKVIGVDFSQSFVDTANRLKDEKVLKFDKKIEGDIKEPKSFELVDIDTSKVSFEQGDACDLDDELEGFDLVIAINLIDRLHTPKKFLEDIRSRLNKDGILIIASPYTWMDEYVKKENWLGGKIEDGKEIYTIDTIKEVLSDDYELLDEPFDVEFVIQEHVRKYQHTFSKFCVWKKR